MRNIGTFVTSSRETMSVLSSVRVSVTNDVVFAVIDGEMAINLVVLVDSIVDGVLICAQNCWIVFVVVFNGVFVYIFRIFTNEESNSSVGATDECHDWRFV